MAKSSGRFSEAEREQRHAGDRERLKRAAEQLLSSEGWERWVRGAFPERAGQVFA
jgi:hypothetical protein